MKTFCNIILTFFLASPFFLNGQADSTSHWQKWKVSAHLMGLTIHTFATSHPERYDLRLDSKGYLVITPGIAPNLDFYFHKKQKMHFRLATAYYKDSGLNHAGYVALNFRTTFFRHEKWEIATGIGPGLFVRENWFRLYPNRLVSDPFYGDRVSKNGYYQYRFFPFAGEVDLFIKLNENWELDVVVVPAPPAIFLFKVGMRYAW